LDDYLLLLLNQSLANPWLDVFFSWISQDLFFSMPLLLLVLIFFLWRFGKDGFSFWLLVILLILLGDLLGSILKNLAEQARPCTVLGDAVRLVNTVFQVNCSGRPNGMPSNHALNFFLFGVYRLRITLACVVVGLRYSCRAGGRVACLSRGALPQSDSGG